MMALETMVSCPQLRSDLVIEQQHEGKNLKYLIIDPVNGRYWQCGPSLYHLLTLCTGEYTLAEMMARYRELTQVSLTSEQLESALRKFAEQGFLDHHASPPRPRYARRLFSWLSRRPLSLELLIMRWRLFPADGLLQRLEPSTRWIFSPVFFVCWAVLMAITIWLLASGGWDAGILPVAMELYGHISFLAWGQFLIVLLVTAFIHESAHGITLQHFGRHPGHFGLAFSPLAGVFFYVEIGEIWRLNKRQHRVAVSLAGPLASSVIGAVGTIVWSLVPPDVPSSSWAEMFMVAGVLTAIYNVLPFFRTDGYFALTDWIHTPNLDRKARKYLIHLICRPFHRQPQTEPLALSQHFLLAGYGVIAWLATLWLLWIVGSFFIRLIVSFVLHVL
ncbi:hypothetical protein KSF_047000 [Reticulibacter mediterranei]|uniref:Peptidase M50 n=1 Tax=Reticulibacter mediterranei TaxID=2778369 RepID=A0A8J3N509_9CHLR|nr:hypothetical protein [Reticulibacter mediterranei]GHO94652.1 hypothetical protein KSF_047000 [Reticulibacter mediterranei]